MKKLLTLTAVVLFGIGTMFANPVDVNVAKTFGQKFVQTNFEQVRSANLELVYTFGTDNVANCYVFNVDDRGFVIVSADDNFRPIIGYSEGETFSTDNPERMYYIKSLSDGMTMNRGKAADPRVAEEWTSLNKYGRLLSYNRGQSVDMLVQTKWNQNPAPYNSMCPVDSNGPSGHAYVGCVATAMAQVMNYWKYPTTGQGSKSYYHQKYGTISANFGNTTYDWDNMLNSYDGTYTTAEGNAVATISFHAGVAVQMDYGGYAEEGSAASSYNVPSAIAQYFRYANAASATQYNNITTWINTLKTGLDKGWPFYYSGKELNSAYGHAFICDGYNDADYFHFNWGWGGSGDNWFIVSQIDYNDNNVIINNFVPLTVYNNTPQAPSGLTVTRTGELALEANLSWTNPLRTLNNANITTISQIIVERNGEIIKVYENATPGAAMSYVDHTVPSYGVYQYAVYGVIDGAIGNRVKASETFGPTCNWTIIGQSNNTNGWRGGHLVARDATGEVVGTVTMTNSTPISTTLPICLGGGRISFSWTPGDVTTISNMSIKIKNINGTAVYTYTGSSADIPDGVLYSSYDPCGTNSPTEVPEDVYATIAESNIVVTWAASDRATLGYNVYRDGVLVALVHDTEYIEEISSIGGHCYAVTILTDGGESEYSNEVCVNVGDNCDPGTDLWYTVQDNNYPTITWERPAVTTGLTGFYIYRKDGDNGEYKKIKNVGASKKEYKEQTSAQLVDGEWYSYKVVAYYKSLDCLSAPFQSKYAYEFYVRYLYSTDGVEENLAQSISLYPNPAKDVLTVKADNISNVVIYNSLGQKVFAQTFDTDEATIDMSGFDAGIYMVRVNADGKEVTKKISVVK